MGGQKKILIYIFKNWIEIMNVLVNSFYTFVQSTHTHMRKSGMPTWKTLNDIRRRTGFRWYISFCTRSISLNKKRSGKQLAFASWEEWEFVQKSLLHIQSNKFYKCPKGYVLIDLCLIACMSHFFWCYREKKIRSRSHVHHIFK